MLKVGLTGSIAVGKSFVCDVFRDLGCYVLDADVTAREVVEPETEGLKKVVAAFGQDILQPDGRLDRQKLGSIVFANDKKRHLLNSIIHPLVFEQQDRWLAGVKAKDPNAIAIVDAALLIESGGYKRFDQLIVVWCEPEVQLQRLIERDNLDEARARERIAAQLPQDEKKRFADHLIDTSGGFESTGGQVREVYKRLAEST